jgi:hypothetical protein
LSPDVRELLVETVDHVLAQGRLAYLAHPITRQGLSSS